MLFIILAIFLSITRTYGIAIAYCRIKERARSRRVSSEGDYATMLYWAFMFLVIAIVAAIFGFGIAASAAAAIGKTLFLLFLVGFVISLVMHVGRRV
jgi:uncharacterized membrane protein YtjA (UPF0391 family)